MRANSPRALVRMPLPLFVRICGGGGGWLAVKGVAMTIGVAVDGLRGIKWGGPSHMIMICRHTHAHKVQLVVGSRSWKIRVGLCGAIQVGIVKVSWKKSARSQCDLDASGGGRRWEL